MANFTGNLQEFSRKISLKNNQKKMANFVGVFQENFAGK